jgi:hypothetical protein
MAVPPVLRSTYEFLMQALAQVFCPSCNGHRPAGSVEPLLFPAGGRPWRRQWGRAREQGSLKI